MNRSDEIRAGAIGFLTVGIVWLTLAGLLYVADKRELPTLGSGLVVAVAGAPGGPAFASIERSGHLLAQRGWLRTYGPSLFVAVSVHTGLGAWFLMRFGRVNLKPERGGDPTAGVKAVRSPGRPFQSQLSAVAWKQARETGPLALFALAAVLAMSAIAYWFAERHERDFPLLFTTIGASVGFLVVIVAGIGVVLDDLKPNLNHFWRSRPANLSLWFAVKYVAGIFVLVIILGLPTVAAAAFYQRGQVAELVLKEVVAGSLFVGWFVLMAYSLSMTAQCLLRQPLYAAICTIMAIWLGSACFVWVFEDPHWTMMVTAMILSLCGTIALGWLAVRNDWGWKR